MEARRRHADMTSDGCSATICRTSVIAGRRVTTNEDKIVQNMLPPRNGVEMGLQAASGGAAF